MGKPSGKKPATSPRARGPRFTTLQAAFAARVEEIVAARQTFDPLTFLLPAPAPAAATAPEGPQPSSECPPREPGIIETGPGHETRIIEPAPGHDTSIIDTSKEDETSIIDTSKEDETSIIDTSKEDETSIIDTSKEDETRIIEPGNPERTLPPLKRSRAVALLARALLHSRDPQTPDRTRLVSQHQLRQHTGLALITVKRSLAHLERQGVIKRVTLRQHRGGGSIYALSPVLATLAAKATGIMDTGFIAP